MDDIWCPCLFLTCDAWVMITGHHIVVPWISEIMSKVEIIQCLRSGGESRDTSQLARAGGAIMPSRSSLITHQRWSWVNITTFFQRTLAFLLRLTVERDKVATLHWFLVWSFYLDILICVVYFKCYAGESILINTLGLTDWTRKKSGFSLKSTLIFIFLMIVMWIKYLNKKL